eukprot:TRINITY_DN1535_c0_g1_i6.p1 TRINITY_DN1535_c0_g1~~TRINITY_DN1535_c0_g1_i6.p1  ORF type:complete len:1215 (+),score=225.28 TRINITY_DN1535_c0_g1_i6:48-3647(+)
MRATVLIAFALAACSFISVQGIVPCSMRIVTTPMRDGVELLSYLIEPSEIPRATTVYIRSPYNYSATHNAQLLWSRSQFCEKSGHVVVQQFMRGRSPSGGLWRLDSMGPDDMDDTVDWITMQTWYNGVIVTAGASALAIAQLAAPKGQKSSLIKAQFPMLGSGQARETMFPGGAYMCALSEVWLNTGEAEFIANITAQERELWRPVQMVLPDGVSYWSNVTQPSVHVAGWYDVFLTESINAFEGYQHESHPSVRGNQFLVVVPTGHCTHGGQIPRPCGNAGFVIGQRLADRMFQVVTDGNTIAGSDLATEPRLIWYIMGSGDTTPGGDAGNFWASADTDWPATEPKVLYLAVGDSNHAGRLLNVSAPSAAAEFTYDPRYWQNLSPTVGGNFFNAPNFSEPLAWCGSYPQNWPAGPSANPPFACGMDPAKRFACDTENRPDTLLFSSETLSAPILVQGRIQVNLVVSSDQVDTDFTVKVTDVFPNGTSYLVQQSIIRMKWADQSSSSPSCDAVPFLRRAVGTSIAPTSYIFSTGHKIRLTISSSNFPRYNANPNTCKALNQSFADWQVAENAVFAGPQTIGETVHASHLVLPIVANYQSVIRRINITEEYEVECGGGEELSQVGYIDKVANALRPTDTSLCAGPPDNSLAPGDGSCNNFTRVEKKSIIGEPYAVFLSTSESECCKMASDLEKATGYSFFDYGDAGKTCFVYENYEQRTASDPHATSGLLHRDRLATTVDYQRLDGVSIIDDPYAVVLDLTYDACASACSRTNGVCSAFTVVERYPTLGPDGVAQNICFLFDGFVHNAGHSTSAITGHLTTRGGIERLSVCVFGPSAVSKSSGVSFIFSSPCMQKCVEANSSGWEWWRGLNRREAVFPTNSSLLLPADNPDFSSHELASRGKPSITERSHPTIFGMPLFFVLALETILECVLQCCIVFLVVRLNPGMKTIATTSAAFGLLHSVVFAEWACRVFAPATDSVGVSLGFAIEALFLLVLLLPFSLLAVVALRMGRSRRNLDAVGDLDSARGDASDVLVEIKAALLRGAPEDHGEIHEQQLLLCLQKVSAWESCEADHDMGTSVWPCVKQLFLEDVSRMIRCCIGTVLAFAEPVSRVLYLGLVVVSVVVACMPGCAFVAALPPFASTVLGVIFTMTPFRRTIHVLLGSRSWTPKMFLVAAAALEALCRLVFLSCLFNGHCLSGSG